MSLTAADVMPLVLRAMPSFQQVWSDDAETDNADEHSPGGRLGYLDAASVARHAVDLLAKGRPDEVRALLAVVERLHVEGDDYVKELATIGYLEDLQGWVDRNPKIHRDDLLPFLGPVSREWWEAVDRFWTGQSPTVRVEGE